MRTRLLAIVSAMMVASACSLFAQNNQQNTDQQNTNPPPVPQSDQVGEQGQQDLKAQVDQMRNDIADLQERVRRLEGGQQSKTSGQPPPAAAAPRSGGSASSTTQTSSGQTQSYDVFYQKLQTGGHWFSDPTYGYVWQPDVASSREWRPYSDGRWVYTDRGWTWVSNEDFGWATYHYGRWVHRSDSGWIWIPGDEWAPAWVSWRESDEYCGWAPLPPEVADDSETPLGNWVDSYYDIGPEAYLFVRTSDLGRETYRDVAIQPAQNVQFFAQTRNVTNIAFGGNGVSVNGPDYNKIASRAKIAQYKLNYVTDNQGRFGTNVTGNQLQVMAPSMKLQRNGTTQPKVERQFAQAGVDHGWAGIDQSKAAQLKQTIRQQAPPPASLPQKAAPKPATAGEQNQPAQGQQQPQGGTTPPHPEASKAQPNMQQQQPPSPASGGQRQPAESPAPGGTSQQMNRPAATPSPSAAQPAERREQPAATPSRPAETRNQPSGNAEQGIGRPSQREQPSPTEHRTPAEPPREQGNQAQKRAEPSPSGAEKREVKPSQENRGEQPANRSESPSGVRQETQPEQSATKPEAPSGAGSEQRGEQPATRSEAPSGAMKERGQERPQEHARPTDRGKPGSTESNKAERREGP